MSRPARSAHASNSASFRSLASESMGWRCSTSANPADAPATPIRCGGESWSSDPTPGPASGRGSSSGSRNGNPVDGTLVDFSIDVAGGTSLDPGTYTFNVTNNGPTGHNLTIEGPGVDDQATPTFTSG